MSAEPRHHTPRNLSRETLGHGPAAIAKAKGRPMMPWQRDAVDVALELDPATGLLWYDLVIVSTQRQSGKTTTEGDVADHRCLSKPRTRAWFTMQRGKDAAAWMRDEHFPALEGASAVFGVPGTAGCKYNLSRRAGSEGVEWKGLGSTFRAFAPTRDGLHSKQSDLVIVDEAWAFDKARGAELRQAIRPTMITRKGAQLWIVSTRGDASSEYLDEYLAQGLASLADPDTRVCFIDYGIRDDDDPEDLATIAARHPAYGHTIDLAGLAAAREDFRDQRTGILDVAGWTRAYGNRGTATREAIFPESLWTDLGLAARPDPPARTGLALDVTPSGDRFAFAAAWRDPAAELVVELLAAGRPTRETPAQVLDVALARRSPILYDPAAAGALELAEAIEREATDRRAQIALTAASTRDVAAAWLTFSRAAFRRELHHLHDPDLTEAMRNTTTRTTGDGSTLLARKTSTGSIAEMVAATLAVRAFDTLPPAPRRPRARAARAGLR